MPNTRHLALLITLILLSLNSCGSDDNASSSETDGDGGNISDGDTVDGDIADGDGADGDLADGDINDGDVADGDLPSIDGDTDIDTDGDREIDSVESEEDDSDEEIVIGDVIDCVNNNDCPAGLSCHDETDICKPYECESHRDCLENPHYGSAFRCDDVDLLCYAVPCQENSDCPGGTACHYSSGRCVEWQCEEDSDCPVEGSYCFDRLCYGAGGIPTNKPCEFITPSTCAEHHWSPNCSDRDCVEYGYRYFCDESNVCLDRGFLDFGDPAPNSVYEDYVGVWGGLLAIATMTCGLPLVNCTGNYTAYYFLTRIYFNGTGLSVESYSCALKNYGLSDTGVNSGSLIQINYPVAYSKNIAMFVHRIAEVPPFAEGSELQSDTWWEARGVRLENLQSDPLVTRSEYESHDPSADRLWDQDKDGNPGMTLEYLGVLDSEQWVNSRISTSLSLEVFDPDRMGGLVTATVEELQFNSVPDGQLFDSTLAIHEDNDRTYMRLKRLSPNANCEAVLMEADQEDGWLHITGFLDPDKESSGK